MPQLTLSLPAAIGLILLLLGIGAGTVFAVFQASAPAATENLTPSPTASQTPTITLTPTATLTPTPQPTFTPLPPQEYRIQPNDTCLTIAFNFGVSVNSIIQLNKLSPACDNLVPGNILLIPQPTPTPSPQPTNTLSPAEATEEACQMFPYKVQSGDTLSGIARNYNVSAEAIRSYNGLPSEVVYEGMTLNIPLCERLPTPGPTPTPTNPPPYPAPNLLLPADGAVFTAANDSVTLQWAAVGTLRQNEAYAISIEDITEGKGRRLTEYVTDTKFIVPASFRPTDNTPHVLRWFVVPVRQIGTSADGKPIYEPAGSASISRTFVWWSEGSSPPPTATP
ncbi:MAG: LysM peptidoglycan-binding domain-containing protein [Chloroflexota bacterium]